MTINTNHYTDEFKISGSGVSSSPPVGGVAELRLIAPISGKRVPLAYHTTAGDGGHGEFRGVTGAAPGTYVDNGGTIIVPTGGDGSAAWLRVYSGAIDVRWFGDISTNITPAMHRAITFMTANGGTLFIPPGSYTQGLGETAVIGSDLATYYPNSFTFTSASKIAIYGYGATISALSTLADNEYYRGFYFLNCSDIHIEGLKYDGRLDARTPFGGDAYNADPLLSNRKHGFGFYGCTNVSLKNVTAYRCMMDGVFFGRAVAADGGAIGKNFTFDNVTSTYNYRQGASFVSGGPGVINGGNYSYMGELGAGKGTAPMAGIDIEADSGQPPNSGITIQGAKVEVNQIGISFNVGANSCTAISCEIKDNNYYGVSFGSATTYNCAAIDCKITQETTSDGIEQMAVHDYGYYSRVEHCYINVAANNDGLFSSSASVGGMYRGNTIIDTATPGDDTGKLLVWLEGVTCLFADNRVLNASATATKYAVDARSNTAIIKDNIITSTHGDAGAWGMVVRGGHSVTGNRLSGHKTSLGKEINVALGTTGILRVYKDNIDAQNATNGLYYQPSLVSNYDYYSSSALAPTAKTITAVSDVNDTLTIAGHALVIAQPVTFRQTGGGDPGGISSGIRYYVIVVDANTVKLATTADNAVAGTAIDITSAGSGTLTLVTGGKAGTFTMPAAATLTVDNPFVGVGNLVKLMPTNAAAATLMGGVTNLYVTIAANGRFTVSTANAAAAAGTETFAYAVLS